MRFQSSTIYATRILQYLYLNEKDIHTAAATSQALGIAYPLFVKLANQLKRKGMIISVLGRSGGYKLARPASEISFYDVFLSVEGSMEITRCLQGDKFCSRDASDYCQVHKFLLSLQENMVEQMAQRSIADTVS